MTEITNRFRLPLNTVCNYIRYVDTFGILASAVVKDRAQLMEWLTSLPQADHVSAKLLTYKFPDGELKGKIFAEILVDMAMGRNDDDITKAEQDICLFLEKLNNPLA